MSSTIKFHGKAAGVTTYTVVLKPLAGGAKVSGAAAAVESVVTGEDGQYSVTFTATLAVGFYLAEIYKNGVLAGRGTLQVTGDGTGTYWIGAYAANTDVASSSLETAISNAHDAIEEADNHLTEQDIALQDLQEDIAASEANADTRRDEIIARVDEGVEISDAGLAQLAAKTVINITQISLDGNRLSQPLVRGNSYLEANGTAISLSQDHWPDLDNANSVVLNAKQRTNKIPAKFTLTGSVVTPTGTPVIRFELTTPQTLVLVVGAYDFEIVVTLNKVDPEDDAEVANKIWLAKDAVLEVEESVLT